MRREIKSLMVRSEFNIQRIDLQIAKKERVNRSLISKLNNISAEISTVAQFSRNLYPQGEISKEELLTIQRRQGALKRKLAEMKMQTSQLKHEQENCQKEKKLLAEKRNVLTRKMDKYSLLYEAERRKKALRDARIEEAETEERISCQK